MADLRHSPAQLPLPAALSVVHSPTSLQKQLGCQQLTAAYAEAVQRNPDCTQMARCAILRHSISMSKDGAPPPTEVAQEAGAEVSLNTLKGRWSQLSPDFSSSQLRPAAFFW